MFQLKKRLKPSEFNNKTQSSTIEDVNKSLLIVKSRMMEIQTDLFPQKAQISAQITPDIFNTFK